MSPRVLVIGSTDRTDISRILTLLRDFKRDHSERQFGRRHFVAYTFADGLTAIVWHTPKQITVHFGDGKSDA